MLIRPAIESDIPAIVELLKLSLGEDGTSKSESYWRWKHIENPFGRSPVLLGFEGEQLVGVRAFMRWKWVAGKRTYETVRAVDTATHPQFRGKGTFRQLTLKLLEKCEENGWDFVFNTPNKISKAGYIKMGWTEAGRLPVSFEVNRPASIALNIFGLKKPPPVANEQNNIKKILEKPGIEELLLKNRSHYPDDLVTDHSRESLLWRYDSVTIKQYFASVIDKGNRLDAVLFYRMKHGIGGNELRITDVFMGGGASKKEIVEMIYERSKFHHTDFITICGVNPRIGRSSLLRLKKVPIGPMVTVKDISGAFTSLLHGFHQWRPSVGDLELF